MNEHTEKARMAIWSAYGGPNNFEGGWVSGAVNALVASGLLCTPAERRCIEACKRADRSTSTYGSGRVGGADSLNSWFECCDAGRATDESERAAREKPLTPRRWYVDHGLCVLVDSKDGTTFNIGQMLHEDSKRLVGRLNALEARP